MRVLLDSNVWRYIVDVGAQNELFPAAQSGGVTIVVAPVIVNECLRLRDKVLRKSIIELMTRSCWHRSMPDAFLECDDLIREIARLKPHWLLASPNIRFHRKLKYDWKSRPDGFWAAARTSPERLAKRYELREAPVLGLARETSYGARELMIEQRGSFANQSLRTLTGTCTLITGESSPPVAFWRVSAISIWSNMLQIPNYAFRQWLGCYVDVDLMLADLQNLFRFWMYEASEIQLPRCWLRAAFEALQSERRVTDGNPVDSAIGVHLTDVDLVVSADRNFVSIVNRCHSEAPFNVAQAYLLKAGEAGVEELLELMKSSSAA